VVEVLQFTNFFLHFIATFVSLSSTTYISYENDHQVTILVTSSTTSSTDFMLELHINSSTATGK